MKPRSKRISRALAPTAVLVLVLLAAPLITLGAPGDLDPSFDTDGLVTTAIGSGNDLGSAVAIQSDGKIVMAGTSHNGTDNDFALARYNADGSLDTSFDTDGLVTTDIGSNDSGSSVAIQSDGKIIVAGQSNSPGNFDFAVVRYNSDGSLDTSFDTDGIVTTNVDILHDRAYAVTIQSDGKIVVAGYGRIAPSTPVNNDFVVVRYNTDGSLDTGFDTDGIAITDIGGSQDQAYAVAIQSDGKIVAAGYSNSGSNYDFVVVRYDTDGSLDTGFDTDGIVTTAIRDKDDFAYGMAIQPDGKIVVAGYGTIVTAGNHDDFVLARYNTDGSLDTSFDTDGKVVTDLALRNDHGYSVALHSDGKIVVAGYSQNATDLDFAVVRYNADGSLDTGFSGDGQVITPIGSSHEQGNAVAIQSDGKIVVAGQSHNGSNYDFALARYDSSTVPVAPVAVDDEGSGYTTDEDTAFTTGNVLDNDYDPDSSGTLAVASFDTSVLTGTLTTNGDGTFEYDPNAMFEYLSLGEHAQDLFTYVATDGVLTDTATVTITVSGVNDNPIVDAGAAQTGNEGEGCSFSGSYDDPDASASPPTGENMQWDFGDGITMTSTLTPSHTFLDNGVYTVTLTVTDTEGGVGQDWLLVTVNNVAPVVDAGPDVHLLVGQTFARAGSFVDPGADTWTGTVDYGAGAGPGNLDLVTKTFTLSQTYMAAGVYPVTVAVEDDDGGVGTDEVVVTVSEESSADLEISQSLSVVFFDSIFTIVARNNGPEVAPGAVVSATFPAALTNITWTCEGASGASCTESGSGNTISDTLSSFPSGGVVTYTVHTSVPGDAVYYDAAEVIAPSGVVDPDLSNNYSEQATRYIVVFSLVCRNAVIAPH